MSCAPPPAWPAPDAKPGQPQAELDACLRDRASRIRSLEIPLESAANGVVAQCEVEVDRFEGEKYPNPTADEDRAALQEATAAVVQYRRCAGH